MDVPVNWVEGLATYAEAGGCDGTETFENLEKND